MKACYYRWEGAAPVLVFVALSVFAAGCGSSAPYSDVSSGTLGYVPGAPNFDLQISPAWKNGQSGARVRYGIPAASLVFSRPGADYEAGYEVIVRVLDGDESVLKEEFASHEVSVAELDSTVSFRPYLHEQHLALEPGSYAIQVVVIDTASGQQMTRSVRLHVPAPTEPYLSAPSLSHADGYGARRPVLTSFVPENSDSLQVAVEYRGSDATEGELALKLTRIERDTTWANPPYWVGPGFGTLGYLGIVPGRSEEILSETRVAAPENEFDLPGLERGLYRLDVQATPSGEDDPLIRTRYLVVTSANFPRVETLDQMVDALGYIAYEREIGRIREAAHPAERRKRFDAFWGSLVPRRSVAANLLETYYARIEEANLLFSSFKEGWKTDRGMVYVLLGAPVLVDTYTDSEIWRYSYGDDALYTFVFDRVKIPEANGAYENYILRRRPYYEHVWLQLLDRWRSGVVL